MKVTNRDKYVIGHVRDFEGTKGYFIGQFMGQKGFPLLETEEVEISWKRIPTVFNEIDPHFHRKGVEINIVISGNYKVEVNGEEKDLNRGDFLVVYPEARLKNISAQEGTELIVVKAPSVPEDKFDVK